MKKTRFLLPCIVLIAAVLSFTGFRMYSAAITDNKIPEITIDSDIIEVSVTDPESTLLQGVSARDNRDGDITGSLIVESVYGITADHTATVTYAAFDRAGNVAKATRQVRFTDYVPPRFTLSRSLTFADGSNVDILSCIGAMDTLDGDIHRRIRSTVVSNNGDLNNSGLHQVQFQVYNSLGDSVKLELPVEVYSADKYNGRLELKQYLVYLNQGAAFNEKAYLDTFSYGARELKLSSAFPEGFVLKTEGTVNTRESGVYPVSYTASYTVSGMEYTGYSKLIVIIEE